jgi:hypothetical protein
MVFKQTVVLSQSHYANSKELNEKIKQNVHLSRSFPFTKLYTQ